MELVFKNVPSEDKLMLDTLNSFRRDSEESCVDHMALPIDMIEDESAYHDMLGLKGTAIEMQVAWQVTRERLHRIVQQTPMR